MTNDNDKLIEQFFNEYRQELPDCGFSRRVMRRLPRRSTPPLFTLNNIWVAVCGVAGVLLLWFTDGLLHLRSVLMGVAGSICEIFASLHFDLNTLLVLYLTVLTLVIVTAYNTLASK